MYGVVSVGVVIFIPVNPFLPTVPPSLSFLFFSPVIHHKCALCSDFFKNEVALLIPCLFLYTLFELIFL
jgi:hypothetical protein